MGLVGTVVDEVSFVVEGGKIAEFVRAAGVTDPVHTSAAAAAAAGFASLPATATHTVVAGHHRDQAAVVARLGLDLARVVVGSVSWEYARAVLAGERLVGVRRVVADETKSGRGGTMRLVTLDTEYRSDGDDPVVTVREVLIERPAR